VQNDRPSEQARLPLPQGEAAAAEAVYRDSVEAHPADPEAWRGLGLAVAQQGRYAEAAEILDEAARLDPADPSTHNNLGNVLRLLGRAEEALARFDRAIALDPADAVSYSNRGNAYRDLGRHAEALKDYETAVAIAPDFTDALYNLGLLLQDAGRRDEAIARYTTVLTLDPGYAAAWNNRGILLQALGRHDAALADFERALELQPGYAQALVNRGISLYRLDRVEEAIDSYDRALQSDPGNSLAWMNRGVAQQQLGRWQAAQQDYCAALRADPRNADAHRNLGLCRLLLQDFAGGWPEYEWRWQTAQYAPYRQHGGVAEWDGRPLRGSLLVWGEQGLGDQIFFAGMLSDLRARVDRVIVTVDARLVPLFRRAFPDFTIVPAGRPEGLRDVRCDAQIAIGSLGRHLRLRPPAAPRAYLQADRATVALLRRRLQAPGRIICGLSWGSRNAELGDRKSLPLEALAPLFGLGGILAVDLQYGDTAAEREALFRKTGHRLTHLPDIDNFLNIDGLAALIGACDVVVTVSNTTAHLAAALGKPVCLLLASSSTLLWYWHVGLSCSPWYPDVRIFRQTASGCWTEPVTALAAHVARRHLHRVSDDGRLTAQ
jgi:tetratricopeptide (TPR) repeat protein